MSKATKPNPVMEGAVNRAVDFSLKKEDLMLLILEGRKEVMEEQIGKLQTISTNLKDDFGKAKEKLLPKIKKVLYKTLSTEAKKIAKSFGKNEEDETDLEKVFNLNLNVEEVDIIKYIKYETEAIGEGRGSSYIKVQRNRTLVASLFNRVKMTMQFSLHGKTFANKADVFSEETIRACAEYPKTILVLDQDLSLDFQKELPEYKEAEAIAKELGENETLLSDLISEYDLFNRNQPRAKAKMIKQVLQRDDAGQALLGNIFDAAKGVKLLATNNG